MKLRASVRFDVCCKFRNRCSANISCVNDVMSQRRQYKKDANKSNCSQPKWRASTLKGDLGIATTL